MGRTMYCITFNGVRITRRILKIVLLCILIGILPLVKLLVPVPLQLADTYYVWRLLTDKQAFPTEIEINQNNSSISVSVNKTIIRDHLLRMGPLPNKTLYQSDSVIGHFMPLMSLDDRVNLLTILETFVRICEKENLTYFLWGGSLLGSYRHHGFIPWDDDFDLVMNGSEWRRIRSALSRVKGYGLLAPGDNHWKFFKNDLTPVPNELFTWPFLDIFFYRDDFTYMWALSKSIKFELVHPVEDIFPLQRRPFENLDLMVPCKTEEILLNLYGDDNCYSPSCTHRNGAPIDSVYIPCHQLYHIFPFVFRQKDENSGNILEILKQGNKILRHMSVPYQQCVRKK